MFKKRETTLQNISYISIMVALNAVFILLTSVLPWMFLMIIFVLPLTSSITWIYCRKKFFIIYVVASVLITLSVYFYKISDVVFYVFPSLIVGGVFGLLFEKHCPVFYIILITTLIQSALTYASFPLIKLIVEIDTIEYFLKIFALDTFAYKEYLHPTFIFVISSIQMLITFMVISEGSSKIGFIYEPREINMYFLYIIELGFILLSISFTFLYGPISFLLMAFTIYTGIYILSLDIISDKKKTLFVLLGVVVTQVLVYAALNKYVPAPFQILLFEIMFALESLYSFINLEIKKHRNFSK